MKKLFALFTVVLFAVMSLNLNTLTVAADDAKTYYVKYKEETKDWWFQEGSTWDEAQSGSILYFLTLGIKDGDHIVVEATAGEQELHFDNVNLGSLTVMVNKKVSVFAKSIKDCYVLTGAFANIHAPVTNGYLYDFSVANFHSNCDNLTLEYTSDLYTISVAVVGSCDALKVQQNAAGGIVPQQQYYGIKSGLYFGGSKLQNPDASGYSTTPVNTAPAKPSTPADEYDDVPQTGETGLYLMAFSIAALCFAASYGFKKRA